VIQFDVDENCNLLIVRGLKRRQSEIDMLLVQEVGLRLEDDPVVLAWAAGEGRIILTHDIRTMPRFAMQRIESGQNMPGLIVVPDQIPIGPAIADLLLIAECTEFEEWQGRIEYLPL
jgi:hypothetical protein